jgi:very-short-patch-repair endonuclease
MKRTKEQITAFCLARAEEMRFSPTPAESRMREILEPMGFKFQYALLLYGMRPIITDFFNPKKNLVVEIDGGYHAKRRGPDGRRDRALERHGIRTIRISNQEALEESVRYLKGVVKRYL